jgi:Leucine-rich repeat (LRR) protein
MTSLQILNVSHNNITSLPQSIKKCLDLQVIDVSYNELCSFPGDLALQLPQLQSFLVDGNPAHEAIDGSKGRKPKRQKTTSE